MKLLARAKVNAASSASDGRRNRRRQVGGIQRSCRARPGAVVEAAQRPTTTSSAESSRALACPIARRSRACSPSTAAFFY
jgi:hypothetical protein